MRVWSVLDFGTKGYPEKIARRLRVVNLICWVAAIPLYLIAMRRLSDPETIRWGIEATTVATLFAVIPLLHRVNAVAGLIALITLAYVDTWRVTLDGGTGGGYWLAFFAGSAFAILIVGAERPILSVILGLVSGSAAIAVHLYVPFATGDQPPHDQFTMLLVNIGRTQLMLFLVVFFGARQIAKAEAVAETERDRSDGLLANILPPSIADRLKKEPKAKIADRYENASVLFADMAGFTALAEAMAPEALVRFLDRVYSDFDGLVEQHGLEKIKTSGDAYMAVGGVPVMRPDHATALVRLGLDMLARAERFEHYVGIRIGIASGPVVAGVVGSRKFFYDVWGDTVNVAARMEQTGPSGRIQVAESTAALIADEFILEARGQVHIKGKGNLRTFLVRGADEKLPGFGERVGVLN